MADEQAASEGTEPQGGEEPTEEQLREQLEEEIRKVRIEDVVLQSVVSILNLSARRIAKEDERDLDQAKIGIDAARALVDLVKPEAQPQLRQAISELQMLYAKQVGDMQGGSADERARDSATREGSEEPPVSGEAGSRRGSGAEESDSEQGSSSPPEGESGLWTPPTAG